MKNTKKTGVLGLALCLSLGLLSSCEAESADQGQTDQHVHEAGLASQAHDPFVVQRSEAEWKKMLPAEAFYVLREEGTERAFSGRYDKNKKDGVYYCAGCGNPIFDSKHKYDSGTGWPSFYKPISSERVGTQQDNTLFTARTEVHCARCGGHLGHIFDDGPKPTGLRYCLNSVSLNFKERAAAPPPLLK